MVNIKHIAKKPSPSDGERIYVDRLWADGAFTEFVKISEWNQDVAPSYELWRFNSDPANWQTFLDMYRKELTMPVKQRALQQLLEKVQNGKVTLVYGNGDASHNVAAVLRDLLAEMSSTRKAA